MTLAQLIRERHDKWKTRPSMMIPRDGTYVEVSWDEYYTKARRIASALVKAGFAPGDRAAVLSPTRYEWALADTAALSAGGITVPIYPSLTALEISKLLERSGAKIVFADDAEQVEKLKEIFSGQTPVERAVIFDSVALSGVEDKRFVALDAFAEGGDAADPAVDARIDAGKESDVATIIFTSGTTGEPKGVMLTHDNIYSNVATSFSLFKIGVGDLCLAHLPLAHILERMAGYYLMLYGGCTIAYAEELSKVVVNIGEVRPTIMVSVPRIFEKIYAGIQAKAAEAPAPIRALTLWAIDVATHMGELRDAGKPVPAGLSLKFKIADALVYKKIRMKFGGRIKFFVSGGAPLARELAVFFNTIGVPILEGYGLTETSPVIAVNTFEHRKAGTVGRPIPGVAVKIAEDGEILTRGPNVFPGYYQNEEATREAFTADGWFMTGDIGEIDAQGLLRITDRKKDLLVTAGGKNIAPQRVENALKLDKFIGEAMLYGDKKNFVTALIVPDFDWLERYAGYKGIAFTDRTDLVKNPAILDLMERRIAGAQKEADLANYEMVKKFILLDHEFSAADGEVTPTMKMKRKQITTHYKRELDALYGA